MRKEILISVVAGIAVGLLVAFGVWRANSALKIKPDNKTPVASINPTATPKAAGKGKIDISLANIEDLDVITETPFKITGITKPGSIVVISGEGEDYIVKSKDDGSFEQDVDLTGGVNRLIFKAFDISGQTAEQKINVVYSSEFAKDI